MLDRIAVGQVKIYDNDVGLRGAQQGRKITRAGRDFNDVVTCRLDQCPPNNLSPIGVLIDHKDTQRQRIFLPSAPVPRAGEQATAVP